MRSGSAHCDLELADEVPQCPLRSGAGRCSPAVPTAICSWRHEDDEDEEDEEEEEDEEDEDRMSTHASL